MNDFILHIGAPVNCFGEKRGNLARVALKAENYQVTDLVIEEGMLLKHSRVLPFSTVRQATDDELEIDLHGEDLEKYPEFRESVVEVVADGANAQPALVQGSPYGLATSSPAVPTIKKKLIEGIDDNLDLLDRMTPIKTGDTKIGKVRGVVVDSATGLISHILAQKGTIFVDEFWLPITKVSRISSKGVFTNMEDTELNDLVHYDKASVDEWNEESTANTGETADFPSYPPFHERENTKKVNNR